MDSSGATPISLSADSCLANENRCHIATPAPSTPFPYSPLSPYGAINPYPYMSRYSPAGAPHLQSAFPPSLASSLAASLAYPPDLAFHYNPYSALTPTSPLTPSSFWSLTAQQSFHQLNGITFGPSGPVSYNTNAHLFNLFSPNSLSPMTPSPDMHSPSLYSRMSSMPSPYASSPGLSSPFMSSSSMPLLLSPSLSSSVDRPPTYLSDNLSTPSTTPSIKCEPTEQNCNSHQTSQTINTNFNDNSIDNNNYSERHSEKVDSINAIKDKTGEHRHHKTTKHHNNDHNSSKHSSKHHTNGETRQKSVQSKITTTITPSVPIKTKEKHSARVEPLIRIQETIDNVVRNGNDVNSDKSVKNVKKSSVETSIRNESPVLNDNRNNRDLKSMNARVKRELIASECDMSLPSNSVKSVPNCSDSNSDSNSVDIITNNTNTNRELSPKRQHNSCIELKIDDKSDMDHKNLIIDSNSNSSTSDGKEVLILCNNELKSNWNSSEKKGKDSKRESQLKQLQSYRKESHRITTNKATINETQGVNGFPTIQTNAISIVMPKPKDQINGEHKKLVHQSTDSSNQSLTSSVTPKSASDAVPKRTHPKTQSVIPCRTKPIQKSTDNGNQSQHKQPIDSRKNDNTLNDKNNQLNTNSHKLVQNSGHTVTKPLPKKSRISRKSPSASIPVGIAIAQQRTSPKTKSPNDSNSNASQPLKPILPTLSLPVMANSPILITDSPPAGTSLWIKPTTNSSLNNNNSLQSNSQFSLTGDYQLARDSLTGHIYLIRNSSSLPTTPTTKTPTLIPPLTIKSGEHQSKSNPSTIITLPVGAAQPQQFFASLGQTQASALILDTSNSSPLVQISATTPVTAVVPNINSHTTAVTNNNSKSGHNLQSKDKIQNIVSYANDSLNVERGCQASISDDELTQDNMKTTATQVDMDCIHSSEEDEESEGKRHKLRVFEERKVNVCDRRSSVDEDDDESSRDSMQLQIVDELAGDEPPQLPVKSAPVMQFIDHHGLDLLVDSIEEFAAREESNPSTTDLPVNGLQLLSTLAEQRSIEESLGCDTSALRRHSTDSSLIANGPNANQTNSEFNAGKKRQRSESCFTTNPMKFNENEVLLGDIKKMMKTSGSQTEPTDRTVRPLMGKTIDDLNNSFNLRRSERIFINDSVVSNVNTSKDTNGLDVSKDLMISKEFKRKVSPNEESMKINNKTDDHFVFIGTKSEELPTNMNKITPNKSDIRDKPVFCDTNSNIEKTNSKSSDLNKSIKISDQKEKKKLSSISSSFSPTFSSSAFDGINSDKKVKKRKKKPTEGDQNKKSKIDYEKRIDESIETIIKRVAQNDSPIDETLIANDMNDKSTAKVMNKTIVQKKTIREESEKSDDNKETSEQNDGQNGLKKKKIIVKQPIDLYDQKRMKLLDETIDEIIAKQLSPTDGGNGLIEKNSQNSDDIPPEVEEKMQIIEPEDILIEPLPENPAPNVIEPEPQPVVPVTESPKPKPLLKQSSTCSTVSSMSSFACSVSDSCLSSTPVLNLKLTESELDLKMNAIMLVDGLLFVGEICPIEAPDIYGITLHGERQHRPIIYSQEDMLREAIREVRPTLDELEEGQRVCAYWSTQYRHLYPGYVRSSSPHPSHVFVEFDDGDNGRISIDDIRLLPQDYPPMKLNADPLKNLERRRRMSSCGRDNRNSKHNSDFYDNKSDDKKYSNDEQTKGSALSKSKPNDDSTNLSLNDSKKEFKIKSIKSSNTNSDKSFANHGSTNDKLSTKLDLKKKKKKHNKDERHHRHHHNHKHRHCRHHKKCKKHKKSKEENSFISTGSNSQQIVSKDKSESSDQKIEKSSESDSKSMNSKLNIKDPKDLLKKYSDAQRLLANNTDNSKTDDNKPKERKPFIKKTAKQRALERLQSNLSENLLKITSPIRKRHLNDTNSSNSAPIPKKRERIPSAEKSKIAAFLPERQLWHWSGKYIRRTGNKGSRTRKIYYKEIERGREHIRVDDCAVFLSTGRPHLPYIGRIDSMWQTGSGTMIVKVRWFYHPEETKGEPVPLQDKRGALFESSHFDVNDVQTISHKCQVISWTDYQQKRTEMPSILTDDPPNVYYMAGQYEALAGHIDMDPCVPLKSKPKDDKIDKTVKTT